MLVGGPLCRLGAKCACTALSGAQPTGHGSRRASSTSSLVYDCKPLAPCSVHLSVCEAVRRHVGGSAPACWGQCAGMLVAVRRHVGGSAPACWWQCAGMLVAVRRLPSCRQVLQAPSNTSNPHPPTPPRVPCPASPMAVSRRLVPGAPHLAAARGASALILSVFFWGGTHTAPLAGRSSSSGSSRLLGAGASA